MDSHYFTMQEEKNSCAYQLMNALNALNGNDKSHSQSMAKTYEIKQPKYRQPVYHWAIICQYQHFVHFAGLLESANSSILVPCDLLKEVVGEKSGFYVN